jgi:CcmD family protein
MSELTYMFIAFAVVWIGIGAYLVSISVRQRRLEQRLRDLGDTNH